MCDFPILILSHVIQILWLFVCLSFFLLFFVGFLVSFSFGIWLNWNIHSVFGIPFTWTASGAKLSFVCLQVFLSFLYHVLGIVLQNLAILRLNSWKVYTLGLVACPLPSLPLPGRLLKRVPFLPLRQSRTVPAALTLQGRIPLTLRSVCYTYALTCLSSIPLTEHLRSCGI